MDHFIGEPVQGGAALAAAARVQQIFGMASLQAERIERVTRSLELEPDVPVEVEDIILVARTIPAALLHDNLTGFRVVGIALTEFVDEDFSPTVPCVCGLGKEFLTEVSENDILLIDAYTGTVYLQPEASLVARYQAPARAKRFFLDDAHLPAKTASDNRVIPVYARAVQDEDLQTGLANGADGLCIAAVSPLLADKTGGISASGQRHALERIIQASAGLPLLIDAPFEQIAMSALLEAATSTTVELVVDGKDALDEALSELAMAKTLSAAPHLNGEISIHVAMAPETDISELEDMASSGGFALREGTSEFPGATLLPLLSFALHSRKPTTAYLPEENWAQDLEDAVRFGITRVVAHPAAILDVKDAIREL